MNTGHEVAMALRAAYWAMHRETDALLQPLGVTANQFVLLALLADRDGVTQRELVDRASSDANTVRAMLLALETKGLVARDRHPDDGRAWRVTLSSEGRRVYRKVWRKSEKLRTRLLALFEPGEPNQLLDFLGRITSALESRSRGHGIVPSRRTH